MIDKQEAKFTINQRALCDLISNYFNLHQFCRDSGNGAIKFTWDVNVGENGSVDVNSVTLTACEAPSGTGEKK